MQTNIMGWDIGGAHLKAAHLQPKLGAINVYQQPCQLWKGLDKLQEAVKTILDQVILSTGLHVITMTGELVDLFDSREEGVKRILEVMGKHLINSELMVYAGRDGLLKMAEINTKHYESIASANWLASATWAAKKQGSGLFVDIGSTTTDILLLNDGEVLAEGYSDYERLVSQELIYTGIVRTPVMAVAQTAHDQGEEVGLMAEYFATMADVYRVTGELAECYDQTETADGAEKTVPASAKRLARMIGCDHKDHELPRWQALAEDLRAQQLLRIENACKRVMWMELAENSPIIGAGIGRFLVRQIAADLGRPYLDFADLFLGLGNQSQYDVADCAPAIAVACLVMVYVK
jgi:(4-(4-[2-(gamma-L-glutamylamino)ethyl]phenoxymethyl)furan-2-yl)methanamine synthase